MENNNSKQILFSIIGIAILIIAVVGVSFAFFTYSRTGTTNNVITTGSIVFDFDDPITNPSGQIAPETGLPESGTPLTLTNSEPKTDEQGEATPDKEKYGFGIDATIPDSLEDINYEVYVIAGDVPAGKHPAAVTNAAGTEVDEEPTDYVEKDRLSYEYIGLLVETDSTARNSSAESQGDYPVTGTGKVETRYAAGGDHTLEKEPGTAGVLIASGTLKKGEHTFNAYKLTMWIKDTLKVSDTDSTAPYRASRASSGVTGNADSKPVYSDLFYSLKVKIVAGSEVGIGG